MNFYREQIVLLLLLFLSSSLIGQAYLNETAVWNQTSSYNGSQLSTLTHSHIQIVNDTLISDTSYFVLWRNDTTIRNTYTTDSLGNQVTIKDTLTDLKSWLLLRESNHKWYARINGNDQWIYSFSFQPTVVIDSIVNTNGCTQNEEIMVEDVDVVCLGNIARKRARLTPANYPGANALIEGVGPSTGLLTPICRNGCPECNYYLNSFVMNGDTLYKGDCDLNLLTEKVKPTAILNMMQTQDGILIRPPVAGKIGIYTLLGNLIFEQYVLESSSVTVPDNILPKGILVVRLHAEGQLFTTKFLSK